MTSHLYQDRRKKGKAEHKKAYNNRNKNAAKVSHSGTFYALSSVYKRANNRRLSHREDTLLISEEGWRQSS